MSSLYPSLLERVTENERQDLLSLGRHRIVSAGGMVTTQGKDIADMLLILSGRVKTYYSFPDGQNITFAYWTTGMLIGLLGVSSWGKQYHWSAEAVVETELLSIRKADFSRFVALSSNAAQCIIEVMEFKSEYLSRLVRLLATPSISKRIGIVLQNLCDFYGEPVEDGFMIGTRFTHQEIAEMVGASRQWVTTSLLELKNRGVISIVDRKILVTAPEALQRL